jgi:hypothetical protein
MNACGARPSPEQPRLEVAWRRCAASRRQASSLSDALEQLEAVVHAAKAAGANGVWAAPVNLRPGVREHFLAALERDWPELVERYEELFAKGAYLPSSIAQPLREHVRAAAHSAPIPEGYRRTERRQTSQPTQLTLAF